MNLALLKRAGLASLRTCAPTAQLYTGSDRANIPTLPWLCALPSLERPSLEGREEFESIPSLLSLPTKQVYLLWGLGHYTQTINLVSLTPQHKQTTKNCYYLVGAD